MSTWQLPNNPHFERLVRLLQPAVGEQTQPYLAFGLVIGVMSNCCAIQLIATSLYTRTGYYALSAVGLFIIPLITAFFMTWITAQDCTTRDYENMILTALPNRHIVWGYIRVTWIRLRMVLGLQFGFGLIFMVALHYFTISNAMFYTFPYPRNSPTAPNFSENFMATMSLFLMGYIGLCLATNTAGVWLALLIRRLTTTLILATILNSLSLALWFTLVQNELNVFMNLPEEAYISTTIVVLGVLPLVLWLGILQLAYSAARRPLLS